MHNEVNRHVFMNAQHANVEVSLKLNPASITAEICSRRANLGSGRDISSLHALRPQTDGGAAIGRRERVRKIH